MYMYPGEMVALQNAKPLSSKDYLDENTALYFFYTDSG